MSNLTTEQAAELTDRINARLGEFGKIATYMPDLSPGVVRLAFDVIESWMANNDYLNDDVPRPWPAAPDPVQGDPMMDGYHIGYQHGYAEAVRAASPMRDEVEDKRLVTKSAPAAPSIFRLEADPETGRLREVTPWEGAVPVTDDDEGDLVPPHEPNDPDSVTLVGEKAAACAVSCCVRSTRSAVVMQ